MVTALAALLTAIAALVSAFSRVASMGRILPVLTIMLSSSTVGLATSIVLENHSTNPTLLRRYGRTVATVLGKPLPQRHRTSRSTVLRNRRASILIPDTSTSRRESSPGSVNLGSLVMTTGTRRRRFYE